MNGTPSEEVPMSTIGRLAATFVCGNSGRRFRALITPRGRVRLEVQSPQGRVLGTVGETFSVDDARELGRALILAADSADLAHAIAESAVPPVELDR
jgi:hypothetical protein